MTIQQDWSNSRLEQYLHYDHWACFSALLLVAGFDYVEPPDIPLVHFLGKNRERIETPGLEHALHPDSFLTLSDTEREAQLQEMRQKRARLQQYLQHSEWTFDGLVDSGKFIAWSISKGVVPDWLEWAIERRLVSAELSPTDQISRSFGLDPSDPHYPVELDLALRAWRDVSANTDKGKPKARIEAWLARNAAKLTGKKLSAAAIDRIATVANWDKAGGPTPTKTTRTK